MRPHCLEPKRLGELIGAVWLMALLPWCAIGQQQTSTNAINVLLVTGQDYPGHVWRETAPALREVLEQDKRFHVRILEDPEGLASESLTNYDALLLHFQNWQRQGPGNAARENLKNYVRNGGGLISVHFACGAWHGEWPEFQNILGRVWRGTNGPQHDRRGPFAVHIVDRNHEVTRGLKDFETDDELYTCLIGDAPIHILADATSKVDKSQHPMAFVREFGRGRVFLTTLGHDVKAFTNSSVPQLIRQGCAWAARKPNPEAFPERRSSWDRQPDGFLVAGLDAEMAAAFREAEKNARLANEALYRCRRFVDGWLALADTRTGLIPENLSRGRDHWNGRNNGADNYSFMVLTCALTDRGLFDGRMREMLRTETKITKRVDRLGDWYQFSKGGFEFETVDFNRVAFDNAEYAKDGLIPLTEWLGRSPWSDRMIAIIDDLWKNAPIETPSGKIPTLNFEVNGDLLQANSRLYWFTGQRKYLDWALRLGDYYLLGTNHPTRDLKELRLMDHGGEMVNGLTELYVILNRVDPVKKQAYKKPLHEIFESILRHGRNADGMLYSAYNPQTGANSGRLADTWGYIFDGFYTLSLIDNVPTYRDAIVTALNNLQGKYDGMPWADRSVMDATADSVESALNLLNRIPVESAAAWCDSQIKLMWSVQRPDGVIEGWHGDGNFARTSIMYALWKTQGITVQPWREDVQLGAVAKNQKLFVFMASGKPWSGRLIFDRPRNKECLHLPLDYPRINQFPEWFTVSESDRVRRADMHAGKAGRPEVLRGHSLRTGLPVNMAAGQHLLWVFEKIST